MMTPRENLLSLWRRKGYEAVPVDFALSPAMVEKFLRHHPGHGDDYREFFSFPAREVRTTFLRQKETDWRRYYPGMEFLPETTFSIWGTAHEKTPESMHMSRMYHPMKNFTSQEEFDAYPYPEFDETQMESCRKEVDAIHARGLAASVCMECTIWECAWYLRSMEEMMIGMMTDDPMTVGHLERITVLAEKRAAAFAAAGVDFIRLGDDIGMQHTIMMSLELYRAHLKPRLKRVISAAKRVHPSLLITYHSCGYVTPFLEDLIEAGIDVLNPVQPECMDFKEIHDACGDRLSFWGTLGTQTTLPFGTPEEVRDAVLRNLRIAGEQGGLLCTPTHLVEPEVPWENIEAYVSACREASEKRSVISG